MFYLTHLWAVYHHSLVTSCTCHPRRLTYTLLIISYRFMAVLTNPMPVPFGIILIVLPKFPLSPFLFTYIYITK
jgi:hypothetical protein